MIEQIVGLGQLAIIVGVSTWTLSVFSAKPGKTPTAKCHECGEHVPNEPFCRECAARRPPWFEDWMNSTYREWFKHNLRNPLFVFRNHQRGEQ